MACVNEKEIPPMRKRSKAKIWIKAGIFAVFALIFSVTLYGDVIRDSFKWTWGLLAFIPSLSVGFWMSSLVPMQGHSEWKIVTLSFDRIYFTLIFSLVAIKAVTGNLLGLTVISDLIICVILGLMVSRLSGICLRVSALKNSMALPKAERPII